MARPVLILETNKSVRFEFDTTNLKNHVRILSEDLVPRTCEKPNSLKKSAEYIESELLKWNPKTYTQDYEYRDAKFTNVISAFGMESGEAIIVGAHYDAFGSFPGADDNASGIAGVLELARALSGIELSKTIVLIAYSCEEPPYFGGNGMGSYVHANSIANYDVKLMIALEMIGYYKSGDSTQTYPLPSMSLYYPKEGSFIAVVGKTFDIHASRLKESINRFSNIDAYSINAPAFIPGIDFSDHRNYWKLEYPAIMVTDTAFYRNRNYHKESDTYDTLDYQKMKEVIHGVFVHITKLANST